MILKMLQIEFAYLKNAAFQGLTAQTFAEVMLMTLVNGYLAFEYITDKELSLQESSNSFALAHTCVCVVCVCGNDTRRTASGCESTYCRS
jgi:hypothetical protein